MIPDPATPVGLEQAWRSCAPDVLAALVWRYGDFDAAEDAPQEALLAAARQWPAAGVPANPKGWLITVASRRLVDQWRSEQARIGREKAQGRRNRVDDPLGTPGSEAAARDDSLLLLLLCCHPALTRPSQVAVTLRAVGGLTTGQIARAFLVPEAKRASAGPNSGCSRSRRVSVCRRWPSCRPGWRPRPRCCT